MSRKGVVYTNRTGGHRIVRLGHRISVAFKRHSSAAGFHDLYQRVCRVAKRRVSELSLESGQTLGTILLCHGWRLLGDAGNIAIAVVMVGVTSIEDELEEADKEQLRFPGGASLEQLASLAPQRAEEFYNEFDFSEESDQDVICVSYGETVDRSERVDFTPFVNRAERFAGSYYKLLEGFKEVRTPFQITDREWFMADPALVTVNVCFRR